MRLQLITLITLSICLMVNGFDFNYAKKKIQQIIKTMNPAQKGNAKWIGEKAPWFCHKSKCPKFDVIREFTSQNMKIVERCYAPTLWVSTKSTDQLGEKKGWKSMFWSLYNYINSGNDQKRKIPMTAPVTVQMKKSNKDSNEVDLIMNFFIPESPNTAPIPTSKNVVLSKVIPTCYYVYSYGGWQNGVNKSIFEKKADLEKALNAAGLENTYDDSSLFFAGYDAPYRLVNRHNEIMLKKIDRTNDVARS